MSADSRRALDPRTLLIRMTLGVLTVFILTNDALAQGLRLEGSWGVLIQRRDCTTGAALGPAVRALTTFEQGGTLIESNGATAFVPGQRSIGHGTWTPSGGGYVDRTATMLLVDTPANTPPGSPGFLAGWEVTSHTYTLTGIDSFTATGTAAFYDLNRAVYRTACTTRTGDRIK